MILLLALLGILNYIPVLVGQRASSNLQALSRGSQAFSGTGRHSNSGRLARSGSLDTALNPKQMHLELELVAIGVGLQFVELEEGRKVQPLTTTVELVTRVELRSK